MSAMTYAEIAASVKVTAELMGGKPPTEEALTVFVSRLKEHGEHTIKATLKWLGENEAGTLTLKKLLAALGSAATMQSSSSARVKCCVNGCPMIGSIFHDGDYTCRFHLYEKVGPKADAITTGVRRNIEKIDAIQSLASSCEKGSHEIVERLKQQINSDIADEVKRNADRIKVYEAAASISSDSVVGALSPLLKKWGVAAQ